MARRLRDLGEFGVIDRIERLAARAAGTSRDVALGIGDDAAVLRVRPGEQVVVTTDAFVENVHFRWRSDDARSLGRRAVAATLSDLAAMGARPLGCTLSLAVPSQLALRPLEAALRGVVAEAAKRGAPLVGGNVARARETSFHLTALGAVARGRALRRRGARPGDRLLVTGELGRSALARARAEAAGRPNRYVPPDRLAAGRALAGLAARVACIDLSDGLAADLPHLLGPGLGAEIDAASLPRVRGFDARCRRLGLDPVALLAGGGEDYELLFSLPERAADPLAVARRLGVPVTEIGRLVARPGVRGLGREPAGWRHF